MELESAMAVILISVCWDSGEAQAMDWFAACHALIQQYRNLLQLSKEP